MAKKTYVAAVAHENVKVGDRFTIEPTARMESLLGAGYYREDDVAGYEEDVADWVDDTSDEDLLERFEELDVVEVVADPVASKRRTRKE